MGMASPDFRKQGFCRSFSYREYNGQPEKAPKNKNLWQLSP